MMYLLEIKKLKTNHFNVNRVMYNTLNLKSYAH